MTPATSNKAREVAKTDRVRRNLVVTGLSLVMLARAALAADHREVGPAALAGTDNEDRRDCR
jgi:hypothetical protein